MNAVISSVLLFGLALVYTISQVWFRSAALLSVLLILWGLFFVSLLVYMGSGSSVYETLLNGAVWVFVCSLFNAFFAMKFVMGPPLWKPIGYEEFKEEVGKNPEKKGYFILVNLFLVLAVLCLAMVAMDKLLRS